MTPKFKDENYYKIVNYILENDEFIKIDKYIHHGISRLHHSVRVSYYSYIIAKRLGMNYEAAARAGLLHDFFMDEVNNRFKSVFKHPRIASYNASNMFELSSKEINAIESHMFPIIPKMPKHLVSWLISAVDKGVATIEFVSHFKYATNLLIVFIFNIANIIK